MFTLTISGFNTKAEVEAFADWYEGQGEQDITIWLDCRKEEGKIEVESMNVDLKKPFQWDDTSTNFVMHIKPQ